MPSQETYSAIQAYAGLYCAVVGTLAWLFPLARNRGVSFVRPPLWITLGFAALGLSVAVPAIYRLFSTGAATAISIAAVVLIVLILTWPYVRDIRGRIVRISDHAVGPISIDRARWVCVAHPDTAFIDVKEKIQNVVNNNSMLLLNNDTLGPVCPQFHPEKPGHGKMLEIKFSQKGSMTVEPNYRLRF